MAPTRTPESRGPSSVPILRVQPFSGGWNIDPEVERVVKLSVRGRPSKESILVHLLLPYLNFRSFRVLSFRKHFPRVLDADTSGLRKAP